MRNIIIIFILFPPLTLAANDNILVSGNVKSKSGDPLIGANINVIGTSSGTATDYDGSFSFQVSRNLFTRDFLIIKASYIGYQSQIDTILISDIIDNRISVDFDLADDVMRLESVVVTGVGFQQEAKKLGVSIETVRKEQVENSPEVSLVSALRGNVSGLEVRKTSGDAGTNAFFRIRGTGTISGGHEPMVILDGSPISTRTLNSGGRETSERGHPESSSRLADINMDDIESIEVLKGADASAI